MNCAHENKEHTPWPQSASERAVAACRRSYYQLLRVEGCRVVSVTDPYGSILDFLDRITERISTTNPGPVSFVKLNQESRAVFITDQLSNIQTELSVVIPCSFSGCICTPNKNTG
jgi:trans-aconitate methyltransferase